MNALAGLIRAEIEASGPIGFARFMELALYHPGLGYYEQRQPLGRRGDYYTAVTAGRLFGELLGFTFEQWGGALGAHPLQLVEGGAHDGRLAKDMLEWFRDWRAGGAELEYWLLEPSPSRRAWQRETLAEWADQVHWASDWSELPAGGVRGVIFANELLDAMPVQRWGWDASARCWFEWGVGVRGDQLVWVRLAPAIPTAARGSAVDGPSLGEFGALSANLLAVLPDGFTVETCPEALSWWRKAAAALREGHLLTLDYGLTTEEFLEPARRQGTLRAYRGHHVAPAVLDRPGEQDLTAHVNFSTLRAAGEVAGLDTERFETQGDFLMRAVGEIERKPEGFAGWTPARRRQLLTLVHPEHLGRAFRVLAQSRRARA